MITAQALFLFSEADSLSESFFRFQKFFPFQPQSLTG